jgi:hypothetical protein
MENRLERSMAKLVVSALLAGKMAQVKRDEIKLAHCTGDFVVALAESTAAADCLYLNARNELSASRAALWRLRDEVRVFTMLSCDVLKPIFGRLYSESWDHAGFKGSLASPMKPEPLVVLLNRLATFFGSRPELEIPSRDLTSTAAAALSARLTAAIYAVNDQTGVTSELKQERDKKVAALRKCMRNMVEELNILLEPLDPKWKLFGFNKPGAKQTPEAPVEVELTVIDGTQGHVKWPTVPRADYYRVWWREQGSEAEPVAIGSPRDPNFTMEELPGEGGEVFVSAVNTGGESARSEGVKSLRFEV